MLELSADNEEIGVAYPCLEEGYFSYFAGAKARQDEVANGFMNWELPVGEYIVCSFEAECFEALVMDALYKAQQYIYNTWLPNHKLHTDIFCAERYESHSPETTSMEIWLKLMQ
ncbi:GyrI-like domain-containing protein [Anaerocolumna sp. MB42-C2]|uniref:GyrI-like domain-containing protein n=1 Tax=Anaerocolumna sp. MB42-C2 TaxID=3070997 RepID=UPI0027DFB60F|nr:GyrI-like domain-containing protein [Anaerocolumna sp. MB42-C2]WMJ90025.1 effector binding domain-containing protein [Anaerocolumna sp. MB42-C2]